MYTLKRLSLRRATTPFGRYSANSRFCNTCCLLNEIVVLSPPMLAQFSDLVAPLVKIVGDTTGIVRKNASICLAKLCNNKGNLEKAKSLHGPELLVNLHKYTMGNS